MQMLEKHRFEVNFKRNWEPNTKYREQVVNREDYRKKRKEFFTESFMRMYQHKFSSMKFEKDEMRHTIKFFHVVILLSL